MTIPSRLVFIFDMISLTNIINKSDELGSPCFTPSFESIVAEISPLCFTADFTLEYIALIALVIFELTFCDNSFCHRNVRFILS